MTPPTAERTTVIFRFNLGLASKYQKEIFPLEYYEAEDALDKGGLLLSATLDEMKKIAEMGIDLNTDEGFRYDTRAKYERLTAQEEKLHKLPKSSNLIARIRNYRAKRLFHASAKALFLNTKSTSERIQRQQKHGEEKETYTQAVPTTRLHAMDGAAPQDAKVGGIAVTLDGPLDDAARQALDAAVKAIASSANPVDPFDNVSYFTQLNDDDTAMSLADTASLLTQDATGQDAPSHSDSQEIEPLSPRSSTSVNVYLYNSIWTTGSNINGATLNHGSGNTGGTQYSL